MIIIGHPWIESEGFVEVEAIDKIAATPAGSIVLIADMGSSIDLLHSCKGEGLPFALRAEDIKTALFAHALNARYVIASRETAEEIQKLAQNYLFDTRILVEIQNENEIEIYARKGIDGVVFSSAIG